MTTTTPTPTGLRKFLKYDTLDLSRVVSSNVVDARTLLIIRAIVALHLVAVFIATLYVSARDEVFYMVPTTFTNLSNIGLTAYYLTAVYHSHSYVKTKTLSSLTNQHWFLTSALSLLYASVVVFHIVVPAIYWGMLFDPNNTMDTLNKYVDFSHHGADFACILVEMVFNRMELPWVAILGPLGMIILYMFLAWVYFAARGEWLYGFLDWSKGPVAAGWYIGLLVIFALLFVLQKYIHQGRDSALKGRRAVVAAQDGTGAFEKHNLQQKDNVDEEADLGGQQPVKDVKNGANGDKAELEDIPLGDEKTEVPEVAVAVSKQELDA
ncbi:hypothetical protein BGZ96_011493 [Linnemannia gamsii]|uniref:FAR-17a/AIG1-like protein n=1 Tax=Linnemannia gamsii TaxID=64522 RepID=A0ABQ7KD49_9FUNG|nr:hypothetical protein BGZ96_011493 [Linnemannia gamsii]